MRKRHPRRRLLLLLPKKHPRLKKRQRLRRLQPLQRRSRALLQLKNLQQRRLLHPVRRLKLLHLLQKRLPLRHSHLKWRVLPSKPIDSPPLPLPPPPSLFPFHSQWPTD
ncbi:hypothetical protein PRIPAC_82952 [Pristionchus pacificus]|nr:hypothetical protein PRIPAC_82952 [Pristionchus pacificus]